MDHAIVLVVPNESAAFHGLDALKALDADGSIVLYAAQVVAKDESGRVTIEETDGRAPSDLLFAASMGALARMLAGASAVHAGPLLVRELGAAKEGAALSRAAAAAEVNASLAFTEELPMSGFAGDFVHAAAMRLLPGHHAVCANVWEDWTDAIDMIASSLTGVVLRQATDDVVLALIRASLAALEEETKHVEVELSFASGEAKGILLRKKAELSSKQAEQRERLRVRAGHMQQIWDAKLAAVKGKASRATSEAKVRHEAHVTKLVRLAKERRASLRELFA